MAPWLKYLLSGLSGFTTTGGAISYAGGSTKSTLLTGALGALVAIANLATTAPSDKKIVEQNKSAVN